MAVQRRKKQTRVGTRVSAEVAMVTATSFGIGIGCATLLLGIFLAELSWGIQSVASQSVNGPWLSI